MVCHDEYSLCTWKCILVLLGAVFFKCQLDQETSFEDSKVIVALLIFSFVFYVLPFNRIWPSLPLIEKFRLFIPNIIFCVVDFQLKILVFIFYYVSSVFVFSNCFHAFFGINWVFLWCKYDSAIDWLTKLGIKFLKLL